MKNIHYPSLLRFSRYFLFVLLTSFVIGIAYLANEKSAGHDALSSNDITEVADYVRDFEDNTDDPLFVTALLNQGVQLDWRHILTLPLSKPSFARVIYRARPRSPPFKS